MAKSAVQELAVLLSACPYRGEALWKQLTTADIHLLDRLRDNPAAHLSDYDRLIELAARLGIRP